MHQRRFPGSILSALLLFGFPSHLHAETPDTAARAARLSALNAELAASARAKREGDAAKIETELAVVAPKVSGMVACAAPHIDSVSPFSDVTPGGRVLLKGSCFTEKAGEVVLVLPGLGAEIPLGNLKWSETGVAGTIPAEHPTLARATTQPALLTLRNHGSTMSPGVLYRARREVREFPFAELIVNVSKASDENRCGAVGGDGGFCTHKFGARAATVAEKGTDVFRIAGLAHGWTIQAWDLAPGEGATSWTGSNLEDRGQRSGSVDVTWTAPCARDCAVSYSIDVFVEGDAGTSWK